MQLDDFLNERSIAKLQTIQWFWAPTTRRSSSKSELLRLLRQQMRSPERVRECFQVLDDPLKSFLNGLLRLEGYQGDVDIVVRRFADGPPAAQATRDILDELSLRGFLFYEVDKRWSHGDALTATIPQELGDVLAEVLNLDIREPAIMLSLARFLDQLDPAERATLTDSDLAAAELVPRLVEPEAVETRIADLPDPVMQRAVRVALADYAGVLPLERFPAIGIDIESVDAPAWREALDHSLLGTFGHLSLLELDVADDHDCLVLYHEVVRAYGDTQGRTDQAIDHTYACGIDFVTDLGATLDYVRANPSKLTSAGRFFKGARTQLQPNTVLRSTFFMDEDSLLTFRLTIARELDLLELHDDGRLHATRASAQWQSLPLAEQARSLLNTMLLLGETAAPAPHFQALAESALEVIADTQPGLWHPTNAFRAAVMARYVAGLLAQDTSAEPRTAAAVEPPWGTLRESHTLAGIAEAAREPLVRALNYAGLLDIGRCGDHTFVRASALAPILLGHQEAPQPQRLLMVNPDFEVVLFPEEGHLHLLHRLCAFCDRAKSEVTIHLRISQASIERAVLRGLDAETIMAMFRDHCRVPLSQNIEYSIRQWVENIYPAEIRTLHVLELPSAATLDAALQLPEIAPLVVSRLSPTAVALSVSRIGPEAEDALKQLGIHLM